MTKLKLYNWQKDIIKKSERNERIVFSSGRRVGKTTLLIHAILNRIKKGYKVINLWCLDYKSFERLKKRIHYAAIEHKIDIKKVIFVNAKTPKYKVGKIFADESIPTEGIDFLAVITPDYIPIHLPLKDIPKKDSHYNNKQLRQIKEREGEERYQEEFLASPK